MMCQRNANLRNERFWKGVCLQFKKLNRIGLKFWNPSAINDGMNSCYVIIRLICLVCLLAFPLLKAEEPASIQISKQPKMASKAIDFEKVTGLKRPQGWIENKASKSYDEYRFAFSLEDRELKQFYKQNNLKNIQKQNLETVPELFFAPFCIADCLRPKSYWIWQRPTKGHYFKIPSTEDTPVVRILVTEQLGLVKVKAPTMRRHNQPAVYRQKFVPQIAVFIEVGDPTTNQIKQNKKIQKQINYW